MFFFLSVETIFSCAAGELVGYYHIYKQYDSDVHVTWNRFAIQNTFHLLCHIYIKSLRCYDK